MNNIILAAGLRPAVQFIAALTTIALIALAATSNATAQSRQTKPKAAPAQPAAPAETQIFDDRKLVFSPWVKLCNKDNDPRSKHFCVTTKDGRLDSGLLVVSVAIVDRDREQKKHLRISLPHGVSLLQGTRLIFPQGQPLAAQYTTCLPSSVPPGGCISDYEATPELIGRMKRSPVMTVQAVHMNGQTMRPQLDLKDFAKVYDGPPTDATAYVEQQTKFQEELQKRSESRKPAATPASSR